MTLDCPEDHLDCHTDTDCAGYDSERMCIGMLIYGPCGADECDGVCTDERRCECECHKRCLQAAK